MRIIHQADQYYLPFSIKMDGEKISPEIVDDVIIQIANEKKSYLAEELLYDSATEEYLYPLLTEFTDSLNGYVNVQIQIRVGNDIINSDIQKIIISKSIFEVAE